MIHYVFNTDKKIFCNSIVTAITNNNLIGRITNKMVYRSITLDIGLIVNVLEHLISGGLRVITLTLKTTL